MFAQKTKISFLIYHSLYTFYVSSIPSFFINVTKDK